MAKILLEMKNITKTFPGVKALDNVNLQVEEGEIHALVGENGAICSMYEYFEIFLQRMLMCRGAADMLGATFKLTANGAKVL